MQTLYHAQFHTDQQELLLSYRQTLMAVASEKILSITYPQLSFGTHFPDTPLAFVKSSFDFFAKFPFLVTGVISSLKRSFVSSVS